MTNAEKLAKDTSYLAAMINAYASDCDDCPANEDCYKQGDVDNCYDFLRYWLETTTQTAERLEDVIPEWASVDLTYQQMNMIVMALHGAEHSLTDRFGRGVFNDLIDLLDDHRDDLRAAQLEILKRRTPTEKKYDGII